LVVTTEMQPSVVRAARNLPSVKTLPAHTLNTLDLLNYDHLLLSTDAVRKIEELWAQRKPRRKVALPSGREESSSVSHGAEG
ncbi:MAG: 50S ribosomal protein L4, partial [Chloroflexi bacterium]|nr:50S ribosomal protein L4 [Chloroflexota bacterium]